MKSPLVSVIIPNYNHERYLEQRITSVLNQTYIHFEIIVLDDCSTDKSRDIIEKYRAHSKVANIVYNASNSGSTFAQWKKGLELAKGEWVWIAESDDYADTCFLEILLTSFKKPESLGLIYCDSAIVINDIVQEETFAVKKNQKLGVNRWGSKYINNGIREIEDFLLPHGTINNTSAVLFRRQKLIEVNPFDIALRFMGDKYAFIKILSVSDIGYVDAALNFYRAAEDSRPKHTSDYLEYFREHFFIFDWVTKNLKMIDTRKFKAALEINSEISFFAQQTKKIKILGEFWTINKVLLFEILWFNFVRSLKKAIS